MKNTLLIIALLWALGASGQIYINSFTFGAAPAAGLLLDDYPNAAAAYSLRKLRTAYTGNCIEVRRSNDNTTSNIGFSGNYLDTAALKTFCASTDCFVRTWYDQSGNTRNATQTTNLLQPQIVIGGNIIYHSEEACIDADADDALSLTAINAVQSTFAVAKRDISTTINYITALVFFGGGFSTTTGIGGFDGTNTLQTTVEDFNEHLASVFSTGSGATVVVDGTLLTTGTLNATAVGTLFDRNNLRFNGKAKEIIMYTSNQSSNRTGIESNINSFYNTY